MTVSSPTASESIDIGAPAQSVWALVSDLSRMGEWSPELERIKWQGGATGPSAGAQFKGYNRNGSKSWSTTCTIVVADPPRELTWDVTAALGLKVSRWRYLLEPIDERSCRLTESTEDQRGFIAKAFSGPASGVTDRADHNAAGMRATLERLKAAAEAPT